MTTPLRSLIVSGTLIACGLVPPSVFSAQTDLSNEPLSSASNTTVKPNIFFILDDSGSMDRDYMPDEVDTGEVGYRNHYCNTVYYNPSVTYVVPKDGSGVDLHDATPASYTAACSNGFDGSSCSTNLGTRYYWQYVGANSSSLVWGHADCSLGSSMSDNIATYSGVCSNGGGLNAGTYPTPTDANCVTVHGAGKTLVWKRVTVTSASSDALNYANWYSYYRTRLMMMKAASGRAFQPILDNYRVGFMTISPGTYGNSSSSTGAASGSNISSSKFLKIEDFNSTQRIAWFNKLYGQTTSSYTPLRSALSTAGRYFAGKNDLINQNMVPSQADDPVQYSCQQNFTILTTDGYWNSGSGRQLDGTTALGNQDGVISELDAYNAAGSKFAVSPRPMYDGATSTYTWNLASNEYRTTTCAYGTQWQQRTVQYQTCSNPVAGAAATSPMKRTSSNYGSSWTAWYIDPNCTVDSSGQNRTECQAGSGLVTRTSSNGGDSWTSWSANATSTCESDNKGNDRRECSGGTITAKRTTTNGNNSSPTWTAWTSATSCTEDDSGDNRTECRYTAITSYSCGGTWANGQCTNTDTSTTPVCQSVPGSWANVGSCTTASQDAGGVATECQQATVDGYKKQYRTTKASTTYSGPSQSGSVLSGPTCNTGNWTDVDGTCYASAPSLPSSGNGACPPVGGEVTDNSIVAYLSGCTTWPCETSTATGGSSNTLADVAQYYYKTDLRTSDLGNCTGALGVSVCDNNVPSTGTGAEDDKANWQHMTTFTMGLGLSGTLTYSSTYKTDTTGTFTNIRAGATNWPVPTADSPSALDDLWHAAVNGRGQYFSAKDPDSVVSSLQSALSGISARVASAAAAATSNLEPVAGDNFAYTAKYVTQQWTGELEAHEIDLATGAVSGTVIWSAVDKLAAKAKSACDTRNIKLFRAGATDNLVDFKWSTYSCDSDGNATGSATTTLNAAEKAHFDNSGADTTGATIDEIALLSQYPNMTGSSDTVDQRTAARGANLVNYLRGQRGKEGFDSGPPATGNEANKLYRTRNNVLGDIISAQPVFVKAPYAQYSNDTDPGYATFRTNYTSRTPMVYVAANDGMLHAFKAGTSILDTAGGEEYWAFMPTMVLPNLYKLASENYASQHVYSVDGTPTAADVYDTVSTADCALSTPTAPESCWKTILVGGLNKGGQGYYALDVTNPADPKALWEFKNGNDCISVDATTKVPTATAYSDCHIGYTFNRPIIAKLANGTWAVFVTSGYNNNDGIGYLYVLHAITGQVLYRISTGVGDATTPSGLSHINGWVDNAAYDNTVDRIYGVDMLGNIWRFDVNDVIEPSGREATRVATVVDASGVAQPITTKPELAEVNGAPFVFVATGRYLGNSDTATPYQTQSIWAIKDSMTTTALTDLRNTLSQRTITNVGSGTSAYRTVTTENCNVPDYGWYADLPDSGERVNIDIKLQLGTLIVPSNVPSANACTIGGYGWLNYFNYKSGCAVSNSTNSSVGVRLVGASGTESLAVGINIVRLPSGKTVVIATTSAAEQITLEAPFDTPPPVGKRVSWREIVQ